MTFILARHNGRVQPRCVAQRSNVGCNPVLDGVVLLKAHFAQGLYSETL